MAMRGLPCILILAVGLLCIGSCTTNDCSDNQNSLPLAGFYSSQVVPQAIAIDSISVFGLRAPGDSLLLDSALKVQEVYLPFRIDERTTTYVIDYHQKAISDYRLNDTVTFRYSPEPYFVSIGCGAIYRYVMEGIDYTTHIIDSVTCPEGVITNAPIQNLRIYFRVEESEEAPGAQ